MTSADTIQVVSCVSAVVSSIGAIGAIAVALLLGYRASLPQIVLYLDHDSDHSCMYFVVKNVGNGVAHDISIHDFDFTMVDSKFLDYAKNRSFITKGIPCLVPGSSRRTVILAGHSMAKYSNRSANVKVSYTSRGMLRRSVSRSESFVLDYYSFSGSLYLASDLHEINCSMKAISDSLGSFVNGRS